MTRRNVRLFPSASEGMTPDSVCYDVIGNMAISTSVDARGDLSHGKRRVLMTMCRQSSLHGTASSIQNCVSPLVLRLQKVQER